jgi:putative aldouronate transport system permease protein
MVGALARSRNPLGTLFDVCNHVLLLLFALTIIYPFWNTILLSFSGSTGMTSLGFHIWMSEWTLSAYDFVFSRANVAVAYLNSMYRTVVGTFLTVVFTMLAAYPLSKKDLPGRTATTVYILITMFFGGGLIPTFLLMRRLQLIDLRWALILPMMTNGFYIIIMRNFMMTIDRAIEDSALVDGANQVQILFRIIAPISVPVIATVALWGAVGHWNAWFDALVYIQSESKMVLQLLLRRMVVEAEERFRRMLMTYQLEEDVEELPMPSVKAAVMLLTIGPIILVYPFIQRYFVRGILVGSLKG